MAHTVITAVHLLHGIDYVKEFEKLLFLLISRNDGSLPIGIGQDQ